MASSRMISADSHFIEPPDLWTSRIDKKYADRAPRVVNNEKGALFLAPGMRPFAVGGAFSHGASGQELKEFATKTYASARPSGWDPAERIKDQEVDGVEAEVLYTTLGMSMFSLLDIELQQACFRVYNDWAAEFCSYNPKRLTAVALISLEEVDEGIRELRRCAKMGLKGAMICGSPSADRPYQSPAYDPFWTVAQELGAPISLHLVTGRKVPRKPRDSAAANSMSADQEPKVLSKGFSRSYMTALHEIQCTFIDLILGGVLERFPRLKLVSAENDTGWLPHFLYRLDHAFEKFGPMSEQTPLALKPSEYARRQLWATFQDDPVGPTTYKFFGEDRYMWASDFPHSDCTWPHSREVVERDFADVPAEVKQKIVYDNAAKLYGIGLS
ncbi:MAG: amidohydrolase family protein [Candidatus Binataceae bacterium]